tara:strand:- start:667 stop:1593 length:927 start_codon:yes stop_codon:yes gene_type:complete
MIKLYKPKFWDKKKGLISIILYPFSLIYVLVNLFNKKFSKVKQFKIPVICVGNIYLGGTGKTPASIFLASEFSKIGKKAVILRKYYKEHSDEYNLIKNYTKNLIIDKNRVVGLKKAEKSKFDIVILDDGLQDYSIKKDLKIACFNSDQLIGNGFVLPSGPLREGLSALKDIKIVLINGDLNKDFEKKILSINKDIEIFYSSYKPTNIEEFKNKKLFAIAGIGNPENFFQLIKKYNLKICKKKIFPDHYKFSRNEIQDIIKEAEDDGYQIVMTEKDYFKINNYNLNNIKYLKVSLEIKKKEKFMNMINL